MKGQSVRTQLCVLAGTLLLAGVASTSVFGGALVYQHDDGTPGGSASYSSGNDALVGNWFATDAGFNDITGITVFWGQAPGAPVTLGVVNDPNGDGNLADGTLLQSVTITPGVGDIGHFVTYAITPAVVGGGFFVGAFIDNGPGGDFPIYFDTSAGNSALGFSRGVQTQGTFLQLAQAAPTFPDSFWIVRANAVPEPGTVALLGLGLAGLVASRRRKQ